ncbi:MAG TPA: TylF/MycF/NovP-related O-methyltransferase [Terracidiphilus sp.]|jgi:hypothetical protein
MRDELSSFFRSARRRLQSPLALTSLPDVPEMKRILRGSVFPYDGYQRGTLLKYGGLMERVIRDPDYREAIAASRLPDVRSMVDEARCASLFLLIRFFLRNLECQNIIEFGAFKGGNAIFMAMLLRKYYPSARILALDTFAGLPDIKEGIDNPPQEFNSANLKRIRATAEQLRLNNLEFVQGLVEDTAKSSCERLGKVGLAHIDVVLYEPTAFVQELVWNYMTPGGYIVQDDALEPTCPGALLAVEELICNHGSCTEQIWPHIVFRTPGGS